MGERDMEMNMPQRLRELVRTLYGVEQPQGCPEEEIAAAKALFGGIPAAVESFWRTFGHTRRLTYVQDNWCFPQTLREVPADCLPLLDENQYVYEAAVLQKDLSLPDPPVYLRRAADGGPWELSAPTVSEFLEAALTYEAVWQLEHSPDAFYELSAGDMAVVRARLEKRPAVLRNWFTTETTFYSSRPDNLVVVMDMGGGDYQALYGGATKESYAALLEVMEGLGEAI